MALESRKLVTTLILLAGVFYAVPMNTGGPRTASEATLVAPFVKPTFEVSLRRGQLLLGGHTVSARHEANLKRTAREKFPDQQLETVFSPLGVAPDWWATATRDLVAALASLQAPSAEMRHDRLRISAVVADPSVAETTLESLRNSLPDSLDIDLRLTNVGGNIDTGAVCERQFASLDLGPVRFEESGAGFLSSAYPVLDRVITLADACRGALIRITGHTDSSGDESWNRQLSLARASSVATHLSDRGINADRLVVEGAGSSVPVADNATRYGRSLNRRIEIEFLIVD